VKFRWGNGGGSEFGLDWFSLVSKNSIGTKCCQNPGIVTLKTSLPSLSGYVPNEARVKALIPYAIRSLHFYSTGRVLQCHRRKIPSRHNISEAPGKIGKTPQEFCLAPLGC